MKTTTSLLAFIAAAGVLGFGFPESRKPLAEIYKTGKARFVQELVLDEKSMPDGVMFVGPSDLAVDSGGRVYIVDFSDNNLKLLDAAGKFLKIVGRKGQGPGEFSMPTDIAVSGGRLAVWDMGNRRLSLFTLNGDFIKSEDAAAFTARPWKLGALPSDGFVLETEKIFFNEPDRPQECSIDTLSPELKTKKAVYRQAVLRNKYRRQGSVTFNVIQPFGADVYWDVMLDGRIVIGYSDKYEIAVFNADGTEELRFEHPYEPVKVSAEDEKNFFDGMSYTEGGAVKRGAPPHIVKNTIFPKFKAAFDALLVDSDGNILVHQYPRKKGEGYRYFDAFDARGKFLSRVHVEGDVLFPSALRRSPIVDGAFWAVDYDSEDSPRIAKYRISE